jgi:hypothetical protein
MSSEFREKRYDYILRLWGYFARRWEPIVLALILLALSVVWLPEAMVNRSYRGDQQRSIASGNNYAKLVDDYRKTLVQIIGGAFLLYGLYLTHRRTKATEDTLRTTQESLKVTRETQITDRFTKAITQLGATDSQGKKQLEIRFGGIYALEWIAKDSPDDHWSIMEILTAYVRENAPWRRPKNEDYSQAFTDPAKDIQAIMTVIGRRRREQDKGLLDLTCVDLRKANFTDAHLEGANLRFAHLEGAFLAGAHLEGAFLGGAHLEGAFLGGAHLERAFLGGAHLERAFLLGALLEGAIFMDESLGGANLTQEQINSAHGDHTTKLPPGLTYPEHWLKAPSEQDTTA